MVNCTQEPSGTGVLFTTVWKVIVPASVVCRLTLTVSFWVAEGPSFTHTLTEYWEPLYILLLTLICGPSKAAVRLVVRRLCVPPCASAVVFPSTDPARELQPSAVPSSKL